jgi:hypothetical protein
MFRDLLFRSLIFIRLLVACLCCTTARRRRRAFFRAAVVPAAEREATLARPAAVAAILAVLAVVPAGAQDEPELPDVGAPGAWRPSDATLWELMQEGYTIESHFYFQVITVAKDGHVFRCTTATERQGEENLFHRCVERTGDPAGAPAH